VRWSVCGAKETDPFMCRVLARIPKWVLVWITG
jgi:hypothetical protein